MSTGWKVFVGVLVVIALLPLALGGLAPSGAAGSLRVITYNVLLMPSPADLTTKRSNPDYRVKRIVEEVSKFDIVALQEVFHEKRRLRIIEGVRSAWGGELYSMESPNAEGHFTSGGCLLLSRFPFAETNSVVYKNYSTIEAFGMRADGLAAKGVIHARVLLDDVAAVDIFVTHIEAADPAIRPSQYAEMARFIDDVGDPAIPMMLLGDLNTNGNPIHWTEPNSLYSQLMGELARVRPHPVVDIWRELRGTEPGGTSEQDPQALGNRIDYVILSDGNVDGLVLTPEEITIEVFLDSEVVALSDHNAIIAEFKLSLP